MVHGERSPLADKAGRIMWNNPPTNKKPWLFFNQGFLYINNYYFHKFLGYFQLAINSSILLFVASLSSW
jgi:hypothetical protein